MFSYIYPLTLKKSGSVINPQLELLLYRNQYQLATPDAFYSDGNRYRPALAAIKQLKTFLPDAHSVLCLGTGVGSLVRVIAANGYQPQYTLVELDKVVLGWAIELLGEYKSLSINPVCMDAQLFMERNKALYDFIFIDIFNGRVVPPFVTQLEFLNQCKQSLKPGGRVAFNYIMNDPLEWEATIACFSTVYPDNIIIDLGVNKVLVSR